MLLLLNVTVHWHAHYTQCWFSTPFSSYCKANIIVHEWGGLENVPYGYAICNIRFTIQNRIWGKTEVIKMRIPISDPSLKKTSLLSLIMVQNVRRWKMQNPVSYWGGICHSVCIFYCMPLGWKITLPNRFHGQGSLLTAGEIWRFCAKNK